MWAAIAVVVLAGTLLSILFVLGLLTQWQRAARAEEEWQSKSKTHTDTTA